MELFRSVITSGFLNIVENIDFIKLDNDVHILIYVSVITYL